MVGGVELEFYLVGCLYRLELCVVRVDLLRRSGFVGFSWVFKLGWCGGSRSA